MFSGLVSTIQLCREQGRPLARRESLYRHTWPKGKGVAKDSLRDEELVNRQRRAHEEAAWEYLLGPYRDQALVPADGKDGVVAAGPARGRVDEEVHGLVHDGGGRGLGEHDVQIRTPEDLLQRVEREPTQFAFDEIWAVLHDGLEFEVAIAALPPRDEVQHVRAVGRLPVFSALGAREGDGERGEHGEVRGLVAHPEQAREEVDLAGDGGDGQQARVSDDEEREYCLVGEGGVDVGRLLEDDDVAARALGR
jgi:hypothetical protein